MTPRVTAWAHAGAVLGVVMALDQVTKQVALASLDRGDPVNVFFGVDLNLVRNRGIAFGALSGGGWPITALTIAALALLVGYFARNADIPGLWLPVGAVLGGALGNLADRVREGTVIDFLDPVLWPSFNLADIAIVLGVLGLLYVIDGPRPDRAGPAPSGGGEAE